MTCSTCAGRRNRFTCTSCFGARLQLVCDMHSRRPVEARALIYGYQIRPLGLDTIETAARALGVAPGWLAYGVDSAPGGSVEGIGARMAEARRAAGLTIRQLAKATRVPECTIRRAELGGVRRISDDAGARFAEALGVCPAWLAYGEGAGLGAPGVGALASARYLAA